MLRRIYRACLYILPADLRNRFEVDMEEILEKKLEAAHPSRLRTVGVWWGAIGDVVRHGSAMRWHDRPHSAGAGSAMVDLRYALRALWSTRGVTAISIATLAMGIGAATATWSVVSAVLLETPPVDAPDDLVFLWPEVNGNKSMALLAEERMPSVASVSGLSLWTLTITGAGEPAEIDGLLVAPGYFEMLGVRPLLGPGFSENSDLPGEPGEVVLSHGFWVDFFGADREIIGRLVDIGGASQDRRQVVGVMPPGVERIWRDADVWVPLHGDRNLGLQDDNTWYVNERLARLAPGATIEQASSEMTRLATEIQAELPSNFTPEDASTASVRRYREYLSRDVRGALWTTFGTVALVLLIACFNVTNLLLARSERRRMDHSIRAALGAGRSRIARMIAFEVGLIAVLGGIGGTVIGGVLIGLMRSTAPEVLPVGGEVDLDLSILGFALATTLIAGVLAGLPPILRSAGTRATAALSRAGRGAGRTGRTGLTGFLVASQIALGLVVAISSGLMLRSLDAILSLDGGLQGDGVVTFKPNPPSARYADAEAFSNYYREVAQRIDRLPFVEATGAINLLPGTSDNWSFPTYVEDNTVEAGDAVPSVNFRALSGDYFAVTGMTMVEGRAPGAADRADTDPVVVVNEAFVRTFWPTSTGIGKTLSLFSRNGTPYRVVGIVEDVRQHGYRFEVRPEMYFSESQVSFGRMSMWMMVDLRPSTGELDDHMSALRAATWEVDPEVPITGMAELDDALVSSADQVRFLTASLTAFGFLALALCSVGVFGVSSYSTGRRTAEFGLRVALGSSSRKIVTSALAREIRPVCAGLLVGLLLAALTTRALESVLFEVGVRDPGVFAAGSLLLIGSATLAAMIPAWRASRVDPASVLDEGG